MNLVRVSVVVAYVGGGSKVLPRKLLVKDAVRLAALLRESPKVLWVRVV